MVQEDLVWSIGGSAIIRENLSIRRKISPGFSFFHNPGSNPGLLNSNVRHPLCVLYNSKQLGMLTLTVQHNNMFRPYMWAIIMLWLDLQLRLY